MLRLLRKLFHLCPDCGSRVYNCSANTNPRGKFYWCRKCESRAY